MVVHFPRSINFAYGSSHDRLVFVERSTFRAPDGYGRHQVPGWRHGEWSLTPYPEAAA